MPTTSLFELIDLDHFSTETACAAKAAYARIGTTRSDPWSAAIFAIMQSDPGKYEVMIDQARASFTRSLEAIEKIESKPILAQSIKGVDDLSVQVLTLLREARKRSMSAMKHMNAAYAESQGEAQRVDSEDHHEKVDERLHESFLDFFKEMAAIRGQVAAAGTKVEELKVVSERKAAEFYVRLTEENQLLKQARDSENRIRRRLGRARHQMAEMISTIPGDIESRKWVTDYQQKIRELEEKYRLQQLETQKRQRIIENLVKNSDYMTVEDLVLMSGVSQQAVSRRLQKLFCNGSLDQEGREGRVRKYFDNREVKIILNKWPTRKRSGSPGSSLAFA